MTRYKLVDIPWVEKEWQTAHRIKALSIDGRCEVLDFLSSWETDSYKHFKKIMLSARMISGNHRIKNKNRVKDCVNHKGLLELKAPNCKARLFFFYRTIGSIEELVVCTGGYWKSRGDTNRTKKKQDKAMRRAKERMLAFLEVEGG